MSKTNKKIPEKCDCKCTKFIHKLYKLYSLYFNVDTTLNILRVMSTKFSSLLLQTLRFFMYAGVPNKNNNELSQKSSFVITFSIILGSHYILNGILWLLYYCKHNKYNGHYYRNLHFMLSFGFNIVYIVLPLSIYLNKNEIQFMYIAGAIKTNTFIDYMAILVPFIQVSYQLYKM